MKGFKGLKEAAHATKRATGFYGSNHFQISIDTSTDTVICEEHVSKDNFVFYESEDIKPVCYTSSPLTEREILERIEDVEN